MKSDEEKLAISTGIYKQGLRNVKNNPVPKGQKFPPGAIVRIAKFSGNYMRHFINDGLAIVEYTYAHAYGGKDVTSYSLIIKGHSAAWYEEWQLEAVDETKITKEQIDEIKGDLK